MAETDKAVEAIADLVRLLGLDADFCGLYLASPDRKKLYTDLRKAAAAITALEADVERLTRERDEARGKGLELAKETNRLRDVISDIAASWATDRARAEALEATLAKAGPFIPTLGEGEKP